jgi:hypothetical protein
LILSVVQERHARRSRPAAPPDEVAAEVVESLEAALASFRSVAAKLQGE